ncbi:MAG TPA: hypothetical protein VNF73_00330, partial [Candidatus Saccharimonadales bacterium]|nr:hypothetical protein [Candidatus Saccharimonadales bacterium]
MLLDQAATLLAEARTLDEIRLVVDLATVARLYAKKAHLGLAAQNSAAAICLEAQKKAGEVLRQMREGGQRSARGGDRRSKAQSGPLNLADLGIDRHEAQRYQAVAEVPDAVRADYVAHAVARREEVTRAGLLRYAEPRRVTDPRADELPDLRPELYVKRGDLFALDGHRLMCGDSTDPADVARLMRGERADCTWTDPPFGVEYVGKTAARLTIANDDDAASDHVILGAFRVARLAPSAPFYIAAPAGPRLLAFLDTIVALGWRFHQQLVWNKGSIVLGHSDYHYAHEVILYGHVPGPGRPGRGRHAGTRWYGDNSQSSMLEYPKPAANRDHPTMKPVGLV